MKELKELKIVFVDEDKRIDVILKNKDCDVFDFSFSEIGKQELYDLIQSELKNTINRMYQDEENKTGFTDWNDEKKRSKSWIE